MDRELLSAEVGFLPSPMSLVSTGYCLEHVVSDPLLFSLNTSNIRARAGELNSSRAPGTKHLAPTTLGLWGQYLKQGDRSWLQRHHGPSVYAFASLSEGYDKGSFH